MADKRYSTQEIRETERWLEEKYGNTFGSVRAILLQCAEAEEKLAQIKESKDRWMQYQETAAGERNACIDELRKKDAEIAQLKARLNAVVKLVPKERFMCEKTGEEESVCTGHLSTHCEDCDKSCYGEINRAFDEILHAARGDAVKEKIHEET